MVGSVESRGKLHDHLLADAQARQRNVNLDGSDRRHAIAKYPAGEPAMNDKITIVEKRSRPAQEFSADKFGERSIIIIHIETSKVLGSVTVEFPEDVREDWRDRIIRAINNGAKAESIIAAMLRRGTIGPGAPSGAVVSNVVKQDVRDFVERLDKSSEGGKDDGDTIRGDQKTQNS